MAQPTPEFHRLASQLLAHESGGRQEPVELADAGELICRKLRRQLEPLIGPEGFRVLVARALHLTKAEFPFFQTVEVESQSDACLKGLHGSIQGLDSTEVGRGNVALFASFIWLLATFIGEDIALRNLARIWPDVSFGDVSFGDASLGKDGKSPQEVKSE